MQKSRILNGYRAIYEPTHPKCMKNTNWDGWIYEHISVATKMLKRDLRDDEVIHHLDGDRLNNHPKNLIVLEGSQHCKLHAWLSAGAHYKETLNENRVNCGKPKWHYVKQCPICNKAIYDIRSKFCSHKCANISSRKVVRPKKEDLISQLQNGENLTTLSKAYGVSNNAIKKWCKNYNIDHKAIRSQLREFHKSNAKVQRLEGDEKTNKPSQTPDTQTDNAVGDEIVQGVLKKTQT